MLSGDVATWQLSVYIVYVCAVSDLPPRLFHLSAVPLSEDV